MHRNCLTFIIVATVSFSQSEFVIFENETVGNIQITRSGDTLAEVFVLISSQPNQGSAAGKCSVILLVQEC